MNRIERFQSIEDKVGICFHYIVSSFSAVDGIAHISALRLQLTFPIEGSF
jgi:hypothetical protein